MVPLIKRELSHGNPGQTHGKTTSTTSFLHLLKSLCLSNVNAFLFLPE